MPEYIMKILYKLLHIALTRKKYSPHRWKEPAYGQKV